MPFQILTDSALPPEMAEMVADTCDVHIWDLTEEDPVLGLSKGSLYMAIPSCRAR